MFKKEVDLTSKNDMIKFLSNHFRYNTANSWNQSTSYANNIKIYNLGFSTDITNKLFEMLDMEELWIPINELISEFAEKYNYKWQARFNGRNNGYLVLYAGGAKPSEYKSYCPVCGQRNYTSIKDTGLKCGKCGRYDRIDYKTPPLEIYTCPGKPIDMDIDFEEQSIDWLKEKTILIQDFDALTDEIIITAKNLAENFNIIDEIRYVEETYKRLVPKN